MAGILDSKTRIIDAIITQEGRRQIASGDLKIEYVSFSDAGTYYSSDLVSGSSDASKRFLLETCHLPQDQITFEADDSGRLKPFQNDEGIQVKDGQIISYSFASTESETLTGSLENAQFLKGSEFSSTATRLLETSLTNFQKLQLIATHDRIFEDDGFGLGVNEIEFMINNNRPIQDPGKFVAHIDHIESLFNDVRLDRVKNFKFLPPINKFDNESADRAQPRNAAIRQLGHYKPWGRANQTTLTYKQIKHELKYYEDLGYCRSISIDPTSKDNKLVIQFFEKNYNQLIKLDVIDYGNMRTGDPNAPIAHLFFVGKLVVDNNETHSFVHLFTLVFE